MNFSNLKEWETPRGNVVELAIDGKIAWKKVMGVPISTLPVGTYVTMNYEGTPREFLIVHQGLPDATLYDASCDGTWLLMKEVPYHTAWGTQGKGYDNSNVHSYLKTIINKFDSNIQNVFKQVKIPYKTSDSAVASGSKGLSTTFFLLSGVEFGSSVSTDDGAILDYFRDMPSDDPKRKAYDYNGVSRSWWLRSPANWEYGNKILGWYYLNYVAQIDITDKCYVRPAMVLPFSALVDDNLNVIG